MNLQIPIEPVGGFNLATQVRPPLRGSMTVIPFDLDGGATLGEWWNDFRWPVPHATNRATLIALAARYARGAEELSADGTRLAWQGIRLMSDLLLIVETTLLFDASRKHGIQLIGGPPIAQILNGGDGTSTRFTPPAMLPKKRVRMEWLRQHARALSWCSLRQAPQALFAPPVTAVSHNALLRQEAANANHAVGFRHAFRWYNSAAAAASDAGDLDLAIWDDPIAEVLAMIECCVRETDGLSPEMVDVVTDHAVRQAREHLGRAAAELSIVARIPTLPDHIWAASAGQPKLRAILQEARRRGGTVTIFDHAGAAGLACDNSALLFAELSVADRFVASTLTVRDLVAGNDRLSDFRTVRSVKLSGGHGDPSFGSSLVPTGLMKRQVGRPRVLYVVGAFDGARRRSPPSLNDPVKMVWWLEMSRKMMALPIDLLLQIHPGGAFRGASNPLRDILPVSGTNYETAMRNSDCLVVDITQSTTVTLALCSELPLVLIDYGRNEIYPAVRDMMKRRARILIAEFDDRNLPCISRDLLEDAILGPPVSTDPSEFRNLYAGEFA